VAKQVPPPGGKRRGLWGTLGTLLRGPVDAFNPRQIVEGAQVIGRLTDIIRAGPQRDARIRVEEDHGLDLPAIAFLAGTSEAEIMRQLANRRRQSAMAAYTYLAGGAGFFVAWVYVALLQPGYVSLAYVLGLVGFCTALFLAAFYNALVNWQVRTRRLGSAREFLATEDSWWPS